MYTVPVPVILIIVLSEPMTAWPLSVCNTEEPPNQVIVLCKEVVVLQLFCMECVYSACPLFGGLSAFKN